MDVTIHDKVAGGVAFSKIPSGAAFLYEDRVFIKLDPMSTLHADAVTLFSGVTWNVEPTSPVLELTCRGFDLKN